MQKLPSLLFFSCGAFYPWRRKHLYLVWMPCSSGFLQYLTCRKIKHYFNVLRSSMSSLTPAHFTARRLKQVWFIRHEGASFWWGDEVLFYSKLFGTNICGNVWLKWLSYMTWIQGFYDIFWVTMPIQNQKLVELDILFSSRLNIPNCEWCLC